MLNDTSSNSKKALLLSLTPRWWHQIYLNKLSHFYHAECMYLNDIQGGYSKVVAQVNDYISRHELDDVFFDVDLHRFINAFFIDKVVCPKKVMVTWDDISFHSFNLMSAQACDLISTGCPLSVLKYQEKGYQAVLGILEADEAIYKDYGLTKDIDVLYYGNQLGHRKEYIDHINNSGISLKVVGPDDQAFSSHQALAKLVSRSKIVVNFSRIWLKINQYFPFEYQLKGRIVQAALCGTACVSEYAPQHQLIYPNNELPEFHSKEECVQLIKQLLSHPEELADYAQKIHEAASRLYSEKSNFSMIYRAIEESGTHDTKLQKFPYWYLRQCVKRVVCRGKSIKNIVEAKTVWDMIEGHHVLIKSAIIVESIVNIIWHPLCSFLKQGCQALNKLKRCASRLNIASEGIE